VDNDTKYLVKEDFTTLCCDAVIKAGEIIVLGKQTSKNRVMITRNGIEGHKVKLSTFNRCCDPIEDTK
jgi:hypothetical protein